MKVPPYTPRTLGSTVAPASTSTSARFAIVPSPVAPGDHRRVALLEVERRPVVGDVVAIARHAAGIPVGPALEMQRPGLDGERAVVVDRSEACLHAAPASISARPGHPNSATPGVQLKTLVPVPALIVRLVLISRCAGRWPCRCSARCTCSPHRCFRCRRTSRALQGGLLRTNSVPSPVFVNSPNSQGPFPSQSTEPFCASARSPPMSGIRRRREWRRSRS